MRLIAIAAALLVLTVGCARKPTPAASPSGSPASSATPAATATPTPAVTATSVPTATPAAARHIAVIVMENHEYGSIIGSPDAPYINSLAQSSALATNYFAVSHPSLPNYLAMTGGDTFGITNDCTDCHVPASNIVDQLERGHISWKAYMQGMPQPCFNGPTSGRYAKKHNPFMYFDDVRTNPTRCANDVPLSQLDVAHLPLFTWITPNICSDMHSCPIATGDAFLKALVPGLVRGLGPRGVLFITFDEGTTKQGGGGRVVTIATGGGAKPGRYAQTFTHYSLLRTIETFFSLGLTGKAASAPSMEPMLR